jgi:hypothetical protein
MSSPPRVPQNGSIRQSTNTKQRHPVARTDYYDTNGKLLESRGSGAPIARRILPRDDYQKITSADALATRARQAVGLDVLNNPLLFGDRLEAQLAAKSQALVIQPNGATFIATLVQTAQRTRKEQGAYIALQFSTGTLQYVVATPTSSSETDFSFAVARFGNVRLVPSDHTLQIIATVHTHYADMAALNAASPGVRHSIAPQVSDLDKNSAKTEQFFVYAIDANYVHKAFPNGQVQNKLSRQLDILTDALESYGRA